MKTAAPLAPTVMRSVEPAGPDDRKRALAHAITQEVAYGRRVESQSDYQAVVVRGRRPNHLLHLLLTIVTLGLWAIVWILVAIFGGEKRTVLQVDEFGNVRHIG